MKIALKLTMAIMLIVAMILGLEAIFHLRSERQLLMDDARAKHLSVSRILREHITYVWKQEGSARAHARLKRIQEGQSELKCSLTRDARDSLALTNNRNQLEIAHAMVVDGARVGQLRCVASLAAHDVHLKAERSRVVLVSMLIFGSALLFAMIMGYFIVGRPSRVLIRRFKQVQQGQLRVETPSSQSDELGELARAFEHMVAHLAQVQQNLQNAKDAEREAITRLRQTDRLRSIGTLAAGVAHELGTPIHIIEARANMIQSQQGKASRHAEIVVEQSQRMQSIVQQLLNLAGERVLDRASHHVCVLMQDCLELMTPLARQKQVDFRFVSNGLNEVVILGEQVLIQQAVMNVIANAIDASQSGQVISLSIEYAEQENEVAFVVADDGTGIEDALLKQVMVPFFTTKDIGRGTGLGLSIVYGIVDDHHGHISIESKRGHGTTVRLWFPVHSRHAGASEDAKL